MNPLYDYVFLNLEGSYDAAAVKAMADGLRSPNAVSRKALIVRIPPIDKDGAASGEGAREGGARSSAPTASPFRTSTSVDEAKLAISFFQRREGERVVAVESGRPHDRDADARGSDGGRAGAGRSPT